MSRTANSMLYEALGRATWAIGKRRVKQRVSHGPSARMVAAGVLALGVIGIGAVAARAGATD
ncbi:MAG: hypothetical protein HZB14_02405 [Actinobacteria bacterium]|nr:hypothetical protein [Actinomycetota bacterium]